MHDTLAEQSPRPRGNFVDSGFCIQTVVYFEACSTLQSPFRLITAGDCPALNRSNSLDEELSTNTQRLLNQAIRYTAATL